MTDWQARYIAQCQANAAKQVHCDECKQPVKSPCTGFRRSRPDEAIKFCFECWWKNQTAKGEDRWWLKPEYANGEGSRRKSRSRRSRRTSKRG